MAYKAQYISGLEGLDIAKLADDGWKDARFEKPQGETAFHIIVAAIEKYGNDIQVVVLGGSHRYGWCMAAYRNGDSCIAVKWENIYFWRELPGIPA